MWDKRIAEQNAVKHCGYWDIIAWDMATMDRAIAYFTIYNAWSDINQYSFDLTSAINESMLRLLYTIVVNELLVPLDLPGFFGTGPIISAVKRIKLLELV